MAAASILRLHQPRGPTAVFRLVITVVVYAIKCQFGTWATPHVLKKVDETMFSKPAIAHSNPTAAVVAILLAAIVVAAFLHACPDSVFDGVGLAVNGESLLRRVGSNTVASSRFSDSQRFTANSLLCSAITTAIPATISGVGQYSPPTKPLPGHVFLADATATADTPTGEVLVQNILHGTTVAPTHPKRPCAPWLRFAGDNEFAEPLSSKVWALAASATSRTPSFQAVRGDASLSATGTGAEPHGLRVVHSVKPEHSPFAVQVACDVLDSRRNRCILGSSHDMSLSNRGVVVRAALASQAPARFVHFSTSREVVHA